MSDLFNVPAPEQLRGISAEVYVDQSIQAKAGIAEGLFGLASLGKQVYDESVIQGVQEKMKQKTPAELTLEKLSKGVEQNKLTPEQARAQFEATLAAPSERRALLGQSIEEAYNKAPWLGSTLQKLYNSSGSGSGVGSEKSWQEKQMEALAAQQIKDGRLLPVGTQQEILMRAYDIAQNDAKVVQAQAAISEKNANLMSNVYKANSAAIENVYSTSLSILSKVNSIGNVPAEQRVAFAQTLLASEADRIYSRFEAASASTEERNKVIKMKEGFISLANNLLGKEAITGEISAKDAQNRLTQAQSSNNIVKEGFLTAMLSNPDMAAIIGLEKILGQQGLALAISTGFVDLQKTYTVATDYFKTEEKDVADATIYQGLKSLAEVSLKGEDAKDAENIKRTFLAVSAATPPESFKEAYNKMSDGQKRALSSMAVSDINTIGSQITERLKDKPNAKNFLSFKLDSNGLPILVSTNENELDPRTVASWNATVSPRLTFIYKILLTEREEKEALVSLGGYIDKAVGKAQFQEENETPIATSIGKTATRVARDVVMAPAEFAESTALNAHRAAGAVINAPADLAEFIALGASKFGSDFFRGVTEAMKEDR